MKTPISIVERNWKDWQFQSAQKSDPDTNVCYTRVLDKGKFREILEVYSGENYVVTSNKRSYSRVYQMDSIPNKYKQTLLVLKNSLIEKMGNNLIKKS
jgi:hypothetical protein